MTNPDDFNLESQTPGVIDAGVIEELRRLRRAAKETAGDFSAAIKQQAEKASVAVGALRRYVVALENDKIEQAQSEAEDLERLIG